MSDFNAKHQLSVRKNSIQTSVIGTQKMTKWVTPAFDFGGNSANNQPIPKSQKRNLSSAFGNHQNINEPEFNNSAFQSQVVKRSHVDNILMWTDKYSPSSQYDLAVHKKKIQELETWLKNNLCGKKPAPVLLLTGPAGVGKTTALRVLAKELKCQIQEWVNPITATINADSTTVSHSGGSSYQSQKNLFHDFILRANKYGSLDIFGGDHYEKKLVLVEDYPNIFFWNPSTFHEIVRKYVATGSSPLVFIISDSTHGNSNEKLLFPKGFQDDLSIENISFNPVALTILTKVLTRIATQESIKGPYKFSVPSKMTLESLAMSSNGDVRGAVNALQFACLKETTDFVNIYPQRHSFKTRSKSCVSKVKCKKSGKDDLRECIDSVPCIGGKDTSLFLLHALGKILYCKREEPKSLENPKPVLPTHLSHHERHPLVEKPEEVVNKSHISGELFSAFLQQNYVNFFDSIDDLERASVYLSDANFITLDWATRSALQDYTISIATRGIMHSNTTIGKFKGSGGRQGMLWRPLHKPEYFSVQKRVRDKCQTVQEIFSSQLCQTTPVELFTDLIPYLSLTNTTLQSPIQISFVQEITSFPKFKARFSCLEKLEEGDLTTAETVLKLEEKESLASNSQLSIASDQEMLLQNEDDEIQIEVFED